MLTRCPACATHFRVTPDQLKLRAGRVRCGECQHVFNALDTLIEEAPIVIAPAPSTVAETSLQATTSTTASEVGHAAEIAVVPAPTIEPASESGEEAPATEPPEPEPELAPVERTTVIAADGTANEPESETPATEVEESLPPAPIAADEPSAVEVAPAEITPPVEKEQSETWDDMFDEPPAPRRWPWVLGVAGAMLVLVLQFVYQFRSDIAVLEHSPDTFSHLHQRGVLGQSAAEMTSLFGAYVLKPGLLGYCTIVGCEISLPAKVAMIGIEASDLHPDTSQKGRLALTATLKNRAPFAQQFPHLELTLTDTADKAIVRKVLAPADYLPRNTPVASGMASNVDIAVSIGLDAGELPASGYRLYIFYP